MELLSPAGNIEKLKYAYMYGADAAYIGIDGFSLRAKADNFTIDQSSNIKEIKGNKKLYCALNVYFHNNDLKKMEQSIETFASYPFDAFIISDPGIIPTLKRYFPNVELHLSTQANATNSDSVKFWRDCGFSRVILGREVSLKEIHEIKRAVPDVELEAFIHGAMCLAYSGRCFLSSWMTGRSANSGSCAHSCRWDYKLKGTTTVEQAMSQELVLEEKERPGQHYPIYEGDNFTTILSSKDICMIDHLKDLQDAGVDSLKIEGRMKSLYYAAVVTRAYRKELDRLSGKFNYSDDYWNGFKSELYKVSRREFSTGFFYGKDEINKPTETSYQREFTFIGTIGKKISEKRFELIVKNKIRSDQPIEYIGPNLLFIEDRNFRIFDFDDKQVTEADHGKLYTIESEFKLEEGFILRRKGKLEDL